MKLKRMNSKWGKGRLIISQSSIFGPSISIQSTRRAQCHCLAYLVWRRLIMMSWQFLKWIWSILRATLSILGICFRLKRSLIGKLTETSEVYHWRVQLTRLTQGHKVNSRRNRSMLRPLIWWFRIALKRKKSWCLLTSPCKLRQLLSRNKQVDSQTDR